jgi:ABC-type glycerol-3-phosphate transport system substrate-binding protein
MDIGDQYGLSVCSHTLGRSIKAWGEMPVNIAQDGFALNLYSDRISAMVETLSGITTNKDVWFIKSGSAYSDTFTDGRSLLTVFTSDPNRLRETDVDFGYLPYPKYDERQEDYITPSSGGVMGVPAAGKTEEDINRVGAVIEALSAASNKYIAEAYITSFIENKVLRDEDSVNMYRLMRKTSVYDPSQYFDTNDLLNANMPYYADIIASGAGLASRYDSAGARIESEFKKMYDKIIESQE